MNTSELNRPDNDDVAAWHRHFTAVTSWLLISGDLHPSTHLARQQLSEWVEAGVTDIVDARIEWSDAERVRRWEPQIRYWSLGAHDDGRQQDQAWFDQGVDIASAARAAEGRVMVHCHMGINRGPSMAFAMLLDAGWSAAPALSAIRAARPIAAMSYAADALEAHFVRNSMPAPERRIERENLERWFQDHPIDEAAAIRRVREATEGDW